MSAAILYAFHEGSRVGALRVCVARTRDIPLVLVLPDSARGTIISNKSLPVDVMSVFLTRSRGKEGATFTSGGFVAIRRKNDAHSAQYT